MCPEGTKQVPQGATDLSLPVQGAPREKVPLRQLANIVVLVQQRSYSSAVKTLQMSPPVKSVAATRTHHHLLVQALPCRYGPAEEPAGSKHPMYLPQRRSEYVIGQMLQHFRHDDTVKKATRPRNLLTIANFRTTGTYHVTTQLLHRSCARIQAVHVDATGQCLLLKEARTHTDVQHPGPRVESSRDESQSSQTTGEACDSLRLEVVPDSILTQSLLRAACKSVIGNSRCARDTDGSLLYANSIM